MFRTMLAAVSLNVAIAATASADGIYGYGTNGNYMSGNVTPGGHITMYDTQGQFVQGNVSPGGHVDMYGTNGNYMSGQVNGGY